MYDAVEFRKRVQHCVERVNESGLSPAEQAVFLQMAAKWVELAEDPHRLNTLIGGAFEAPRPHWPPGGVTGEIAPMYETVHCPDCKLPARLVLVMPSVEKPDTDEITYLCTACDKEFRRNARAKSLDGLR